MTFSHDVFHQAHPDSFRILITRYDLTPARNNLTFSRLKTPVESRIESSSVISGRTVDRCVSHVPSAKTHGNKLPFFAISAQVLNKKVTCEINHDARPVTETGVELITCLSFMFESSYFHQTCENTT